MSRNPTTETQARAALAALNKHGTPTAAAVALGIPRSTMNDRLRLGRTLSGAVPTDDSIDGLRDKVYELETQLKSAKSTTLTDEYIKRKIIGLKESFDASAAPTWAVDVRRGKTLPGVPVALWSDWHWSEVIYPGQVNGINEFNLKIAHERGRRLVEKTVYLLREHIVNPKYPGIVVNLGGDFISGTIHEELENSNEVPIMPCVIDIFGFLRWAIATLADEFGRVFCPCVSGNHGRSTKRYVAKNRNQTNYDWLIYHFLAKSFENDPRVTFLIPDGADALYSVCGHRYLLTHGDAFKTGEAIIGHVGAVIRGQKKKMARNANIGLEFDTMLHGHFHTYSPMPSIIGNGSLCGMSEYAYQGGFGYEPPIQALWLTHPEHGITIHMPVHLDKVAGKDIDTKADWVSWHNK